MEIGIFLLALTSPLLYAATNHIDNILLGKYFKEGGVGTLMMFSALLAFLALPILYFIDPGVFAVSNEHKLMLVGIGVINTLLLWSYLQALFNDEPTVVIIYYQLVPVLGLVMAYFVLGETITTLQAFAMAIIILGAIVMTVAIDKDGQLQFRLKTAGFMLLASICWAAESTFFKVVALEENPVRSFFWEHVSLVGIGILMGILITSYRKSFLQALRVNGSPILGVNILNEGLYISGNFVAAIVVVLVPVSLTLLMNSFQPLFVLLIGVALTVLFPRMGVQHVTKDQMTQKIVAICLTGIGVLLLGQW